MKLNESLENRIALLAALDGLAELLRREVRSIRLVERLDVQRTEALELAAGIAAYVVVAHEHHGLLSGQQAHYLANVILKSGI